MNVAIVGLGLIGGSMAKSIKNRTSHTVWGTCTSWGCGPPPLWRGI